MCEWLGMLDQLITPVKGLCRAVTVTVWSVPTRLRPLASGMVQVTSHVLGDVPAPPLVGLLQGARSPDAGILHAALC